MSFETIKIKIAAVSAKGRFTRYDSCRIRRAHDRPTTLLSVLKHVLKWYDIFSDVHNNRKSYRGPAVVACDKSRTV